MQAYKLYFAKHPMAHYLFDTFAITLLIGIHLWWNGLGSGFIFFITIIAEIIATIKFVTGNINK